MTHLVFLAIPTTGQDRLESLLRYFQNAAPGAREANASWLWVGLAVGMLVLLGLMVRRLFVRPANQNRPWGLFFALCRRHRLSWRQQWVLWKLARSYTAQMPARIFLDPHLFDPDRLPAHWTRKAALLEQLRQQLFHDLALAEKSFTAPMPRSPSCSDNRVSQQQPVGFPRELSPSLDWPARDQANGADKTIPAQPSSASLHQQPSPLA